jgi:hypothetical protein
MPSAGFEPTIPAKEWPQAHALDGAATGLGPIEGIVQVIYNLRTERGGLSALGNGLFKEVIKHLPPA